jgi:hypothetical protein
MPVNPTLRRWASHGNVAAGATTAIKVPEDTTNDYVYLTRLSVQITVHANAKNLTVQDSAGTPVLIALISDLTVASGTNRGEPFLYDFGKRGYRATKGKTINIVSDSAGPAASFVAEGFLSTV